MNEFQWTMHEKKIEHGERERKKKKGKGKEKQKEIE